MGSIGVMINSLPSVYRSMSFLPNSEKLAFQDRIVHEPRTRCWRVDGLYLENFGRSVFVFDAIYVHKKSGVGYTSVG